MTDNDLQTRPVPHHAASAPDADPTGDPADRWVRTDPAARRTVLDRIRTPVAGLVGGGILILAAGFGTGFAVGHGTAGGGQGTVQSGPGGQGFGGPGTGGPGFGNQNGTGQNGTGQNGTGQNGTGAPGVTGQGQTGTDGTTGTTAGAAPGIST